MKIKQKKSSKPMLSDKIADALTVKPRADIEDDQVFGTKPQTVTRADFGSSESEDEALISDFRKRNINLLSEISKKYEGKVVSRKELESQCDDNDDSLNVSDDNCSNFLSLKLLKESKEISDEQDDNDQFSDEASHQKLKAKKKVVSDSDDSNTEDNEDESDSYSISNFKKQLESDISDDDDNEGSDVSDDGGGYDISQMDKPVTENFEHVKKQNVSEEGRKGACVRNQLLVWEGLLEMRIHLQKCVNTANQMPLLETYDELKKSNEFIEQSIFTQSNIAKVLDKMLTLQNLLLKSFPETKSLSTKQIVDLKQEKRAESDEEIQSDTDNEEIPSDTEPEDNIKEEQELKKKSKPDIGRKRKLSDYEKEISTSHKAFKSFRDTTIQMWNDKTRVAVASNIKNTPTNTILQQIKFILSDSNKLIRRTQLKRSEYNIIGYKTNTAFDNNEDQIATEVQSITKDRKDNDEYIPEIFDDSDFYHQLLRELIECKSADISDPVQLSRQWIALQQMRSKMKRKVDTKATKGRKIKYVVHNPLVNYMAPEKCTTWTDESTNELYSSLFGKMFERNNTGMNTHLENS